MEVVQQTLLDIQTRPALRVGVPFQASATSRKAAERLAPKVADRRERVLALFRAGARLTADEAAALLGWKPTQARPRVCEAAKWGVLVDTGEERPSDDGAQMVVYRYATLPELREALNEADKCFNYGATQRESAEGLLWSDVIRTEMEAA